MATNVKNSKKKGTYDSKIITYTAIGLSAVVAIVVAIYIVISVTGGYVGKVDGYKIYDYEYDYYLSKVISEEVAEIEELEDEDLDEDEILEIYKKYFTEEKIAEVEEKAMDEARKYKAMYVLAVEKGYKLNQTQKATVKANIDSYIQQYYQMYSQYYNMSYSDIVAMFCGNMSLEDYKDMQIVLTTIENYKLDLKEDYNPTDAELRELYDETPDDYRSISVRFFQLSKPTEPTVPKDSEGKENPSDEDYLKKLAEYNAEVERITKIAEEIKVAFSEGGAGKYSFIEYDKDGNPVLDKDGNTSYVIKDADFAALCKAASDNSSSSSNSGLYLVNNNRLTGIDEIDEYALSMQWNDDKTAIIEVKKEEDSDKDDEGGEDADQSAGTSTGEEKEDEKEDEEDDAIMTDMKIIDTEKAIYVIRCEGIDDFDTSKESSEGAEDSVKDQVKAVWEENKAVEDLEAMVEAEGKRFSVKSQKKDKIKEINDTMWGAIIQS